MVNKALAYDRDHIALNIDAEFVGSSIIGSSAGEIIEVGTTNISLLMEEMNFAKAGIVCDIEGAREKL